MKAYKVSAFTRNGEGGNLAGVVIMDDLTLGSEQMQKIAADFNFSETAFVKTNDGINFETRFFTPTKEVDLCGHATIAAFYTLTRHGHVKQEVVQQHTKAGTLNVLCGGEILMEMSEEELLDQVSKEEIAPLLGISPDDITLTPQIVKVGLADVMVIVKDMDTLKRIKMDKEAMIDFSNKHDVTGVHVACLDDSGIFTRNFAPAYGIDEESATGTASGAMYVYLRHNKLINPNHLVGFYQGDSLNQPSRIVVERRDNRIWVGGFATIIDEFEF